MFGIADAQRHGPSVAAPLSSAAPAVPDAATVRGWIAELSRPGNRLSDADRVGRIRVLEELKAAAAAAQVRDTAALDLSIRTARAEQGLPQEEQRRGIHAQVGLARRESPARGVGHLNVAKALTREMPCTLAAMTAGRLSEECAALLVTQTAHLSAEHRMEVDRRICGDPDRLDGVGLRGLTDRVKRLVYRLDPEHATRRSRRAVADRRVTLRLAGDAMAWLTALVPAHQGLAAYAALSTAADTARAAGDPRARGHVLADTLIERLTGQTRADAVTAEVQLVMTDRSLLGGDHEPARLAGYGTVPSGFARDWLQPHSDTDTEAGGAQVWLRRVFTHPGTGDLVGMDSHRRLFPAGLRRLLITRDQSCRTPYCDAPIRHADHVVPHAGGGSTASHNGQGLCEACSYTKEAPGWSSRAAPPRPGQRHTVETRTPTGHTYRSTAPPPPGTPLDADGPDGSVSPLEVRLLKLVTAA